MSEAVLIALFGATGLIGVAVGKFMDVMLAAIRGKNGKPSNCSLNLDRVKVLIFEHQQTCPVNGEIKSMRLALESMRDGMITTKDMVGFVGQLTAASAQITTAQGRIDALYEDMAKQARVGHV